MPTRCNSDLLIYKISSTCFAQYFAHHQERETEIFTAYGILLLWWVGSSILLYLIDDARSNKNHVDEYLRQFCC